jgi:hypothetical protein
VRFQITIGTEAGGAKVRGRAEEQHIMIEGADLAAALILACRSKSIPLPSKSDKTLQTFGEQVALVFTMAAGTPEIGGDKLQM